MLPVQPGNSGATGDHTYGTLHLVIYTQEEHSNELIVFIITYLPTSSPRMILVSLEGWVERAWRTALREQPLLLSSSTAWMLATSGLVEDLTNMTRNRSCTISR